MTAEQQLAEFMDRFTPEIAKLARATRVKMRKSVPGAFEVVYDNYNALAIGYAPSERSSEAIFSLVLYPTRVRVFFLQGARLPDPDGVLEGKGNQVRSFVVESAKDLDRPEVVRLMRVALESAKVKLDPKIRGKLIIKSISAKQRPRRPQ